MENSATNENLTAVPPLDRPPLDRPPLDRPPLDRPPLDREERSRRRRRLALICFFGAGGVLISLLLYWNLHARQLKLLQTRFDLDAQQRVAAVEEHVAFRLAGVRSLKAFYAGSERVHRDEFQTFTEQFATDDPSVAALGWISRIADDNREAYEQATGEELGRDYRIVERSADGEPIVAGRRDEYFPVTFAESREDNCFRLGLDLGEIPSFASVMQRACESDEIVATGIPCWEKHPEEPDMLLVLAPVYLKHLKQYPLDTPQLRRENLDGFAFGVFRIDAIVKEALKPLAPTGIDMLLLEKSAGNKDNLLYVHVSHTRDPAVESKPAATAPPAMRYSGDFKHGPTHWTVVCTPTEAYLAENRDWVSPGVLLGGLLLTGMLSGYIALLSGQAMRVKRLVNKRTAELAESELRFRRLVDNAGDTFFLLDFKGKILDVNRQACESLGYTRAELLAMTIADVDIEVEEKKHADRFWKNLSPERPVTFWGTHRRKDGTTFPVEVRLTVLEVGGQRLLLGLARDITQRELAEEALRNERQLLRELLILQEQDRKLVGYEIHDGLAQLLAGTMLKLQAAGNLSQDMSKNSRELFDEGLRYLDDALKETRRLISDMRPPILDQSGIVATIRNLTDEHSGGDGPVIEFQHDSRIEREKLAPPIEGAIFRIVQESLNNATKHSQSDKVRIELKQRHNRIRVEVRDWGVGFDPDKIAEKRFGLKGIRERARLLGGWVDIETAAGQGTCISAELPLPERIAGLDG